MRPEPDGPARDEDLKLQEAERFLRDLPQPRREWMPESFWQRQASRILGRLETGGRPWRRFTIPPWKPALAVAGLALLTLLLRRSSKQPEPAAEVRWIATTLPLAENLELLEDLDLLEYFDSAGGSKNR